MPVQTYGSTEFNYQDDYHGRVMIRTVEGSAIAVPTEDILKFVAGFAKTQLATALDQMSWQEVLGAPKRR